MGQYIAQRLALLVLLVLSTTFITFAALNYIGDPLFNIVGPVAGDTTNPENVALVEAAEEEFNLDKPFLERYRLWLSNVAQGDFGKSFALDGLPVNDIVRERLPKSLMLMVMAQTMAVIIAIPWGVWAASRAGSVADRSSTVTSFLFVALPNFALGVILFYIFAVKLEWFPLSFKDDSIGSRLHSLFLPALTLALPVAAVYQRLLRTDLITTLQEDFILMARAKGVPRRTVLFRHALRPSMFSFITVFGINAGALIGGTLVVERFFSIPGAGTAIVEAVVRGDFPVVLAFIVIITTGFVVLNLLVDLFYSVLDPRVRG